MLTLLGSNWDEEIAPFWIGVNKQIFGDRYEIVEKPDWQRKRIEANILNLGRRNQDIDRYIEMYQQEKKSNEDKINNLKKDLESLK